MITKINTIIGDIWIKQTDNYITEISFEKIEGEENITPLLQKSINQIKEYFNKERFEFDLPVKYNCTDFQRKVYEATIKIGYNQTASYQDIAIMIGNPKSVRAVGQALNKNKIPIVIPCHRIMGKNKKLIGFAGGLDRKVALLNLENNI